VSTPEKVPCRICGCVEGEPSFCHAIFSLAFYKAGINKGRGACHRYAPDLCSHCAQSAAGDAPEIVRMLESRARRADMAAELRGRSVPGAYALRCHAARMRLKARRIMRETASQPATA
jgi:hypothetical protein